MVVEILILVSIWVLITVIIVASINIHKSIIKTILKIYSENSYYANKHLKEIKHIDEMHYEGILAQLKSPLEINLPRIENSLESIVKGIYRLPMRPKNDIDDKDESQIITGGHEILSAIKKTADLFDPVKITKPKAKSIKVKRNKFGQAEDALIVISRVDKRNFQIDPKCLIKALPLKLDITLYRKN